MTSLPSNVLDGLVASGRESGGAVTVVRDGVPHLEHAAGTCDGIKVWALDTLVMTFSVAKPFAAWAFLDAVAEGHLELDQTVASVWPAFGQAGKEGTTMRHLLAHQAGLPVFPEKALQVEYDDREALVDLLARMAPIHRPGAGVAEHALTYGHLLDEVVRRATGEQLPDRFARITGEAGWDCTCASLTMTCPASRPSSTRMGGGARGISQIRAGARPSAGRVGSSNRTCSTLTASDVRRCPPFHCTRQPVPWRCSTTT